MQTAESCRFAFEPPPAVEPLVSAAADFAQRTRLAERDGRDVARRIRDLCLGDALAELAHEDGLAALFHVAAVLGQANVPAGWQGLLDVPAQSLYWQAAVRIGVPRGDTAAGFSVWVPLLGNPADEQVTWFDHRTGVQHGPFPWPSLLARDTAAECLPLAGMPGGAVLTFDPDDSGFCGSERRGDPTAWHSYWGHALVLLLGLLCGACRRLAEEAYQYARTRRSAGVAIHQHQAVAIRLGELAMRQQALELYLTAAVATLGARVGTFGSFHCGYVTDTALAVARDCLQVAAGHGYVEGLPIRGLVEQVSALTGAMAGHHDALTRLSQRRAQA